MPVATKYGQKTMDVLRLCALPVGSPERDAEEARLTALYSYNAVYRKILQYPDLFEYGVSVRCAWLTPRGKDILANATS